VVLHAAITHSFPDGNGLPVTNGHVIFLSYSAAHEHAFEHALPLVYTLAVLYAEWYTIIIEVGYQELLSDLFSNSPSDELLFLFQLCVKLRHCHRPGNANYHSVNAEQI
jgi:hypothetical protein